MVFVQIDTMNIELYLTFSNKVNVLKFKVTQYSYSYTDTLMGIG